MSSIAPLPLLVNLIRGVTLSCQQTQRHMQKTHTESERLRAFTETYQRNPIESGASRCCLDRLARRIFLLFNIFIISLLPFICILLF